MKTLKISDEAHAKLTSVVGRPMAETGKMKTYSDAIGARYIFTHYGFA